MEQRSMEHLTIQGMESFPYPPQVRRIVFSDYDETYMPYSPVDKPGSGIGKLETFLMKQTDRLSLVMAWVSGSSLESLLRKSQGYITRLPHFIAGSLGSELYRVEGNKIVECNPWFDRIRHSGFRKENIGKIITLLQDKGLELTEQPSDYGGKYKGSYYYKVRPEIEADYRLIKEIAARYNIKVLFTKCNPAAGDPADCYDVDLLPACCGKEEVVSFLREHLQVEKQSTWAFGDSFNDFGMFGEAGNKYLVANADPAAKEVFHTITRSPYCHGIKEVLEKIIP